MKIESTAITHIGNVRDNNEDNYFVNGKYKADNSISVEGYADKTQRDSYLYAVCDGMGGESFGETASMIAVQTLAGYMSTDIRQTVFDYIQRANSFICDEIIKNNGARSGTTLAILHIINNKAVSYNIGDSRVYFYRKKMLYLMSEDHTETQRLIKMGLLDIESAKNHASRNKLTQHLGIFPNELIIEPFVSQEVKVKKNDIFLLCSDGLTDMVSDDDIREIISRNDADTHAIAKELSAAARQNGGKDNITVVVVKVS